MANQVASIDITAVDTAIALAKKVQDLYNVGLVDDDTKKLLLAKIKQTLKITITEA